jgi:hypothetical protein
MRGKIIAYGLLALTAIVMGVAACQAITNGGG